MEQSSRLEDREISPIGSIDDAVLSPTSRKILEQCTVRVTASPKNEFRGLIARPSSSELDGSSVFSFARPTIPAPSFSTRPQLRAPLGASTQRTPLCAAGSRNMDIETQTCGEVTILSDTAVTVEVEKESANDQPQIPTLSLPIDSVQLFAAPPSKGTEAESSKEPEKTLGCEARAASKVLSTVNESLSENVSRKGSPKSVHHSSRASSFSSEGTAHTDQSDSDGIRNSSPKKRLTRSPSTSVSPTFKVTKQHPARTKKVLQKFAGSTSSLTCQPSEEDLFYLLIHKLKSREQAEAAAEALREEMQSKLAETNKENLSLNNQLIEAQKHCEAERAQRTAQQELVERWKIKFGKLKSLVMTIGNDQETLRRNGQLLKSTQIALGRGRHQFQTELRQLNNGSNQLARVISQQQAELASMQLKLNELKHSLILKDNRLGNTERSLSREKDRTATLEAYIQNQSNKILKQMALIYQHQTEVVPKIEMHLQGLGGILADSQSAMKSEIGPPLNACLQLLKQLNTYGPFDPALLTQVNSTLRTISAKMDSQNENMTSSLADEFKLQRQQACKVIQQLVDIDSSCQNSFNTANQLAEAKAANEVLQERIKTVKENLAQVNVENTELQKKEARFGDDVESLQRKIVSLQSQLEEASKIAKDGRELPKLEAQLEKTLTALNETNEQLGIKDGQIKLLESNLVELNTEITTTKANILALEKEKEMFKDNMHALENKVRAELTIANLVSKEESQALFEQQLHQVMRERILAEQQADTLQKQVDEVNLKLTAANGSCAALEMAASEARTILEDLKGNHQKEIADRDEAISKLESIQIANIEVEQKLEVSLTENSRLQLELSAAQSNGDSQLALLQESFDLMREEGNQKDKDISSLTAELAAVKEKSNLAQAEEKDKIKNIQTMLDEAQKDNTDLANRLKQRDDDIACLAAEMELSKKGTVAEDLKQVIHVKDEELQKLQRSLQTAEKSLVNCENILRRFNILGEQDSLENSWDKIEKRLGPSLRTSDPNEMLLDADEVADQVPKNPKLASKRKRKATSGPNVHKAVSPPGSGREYKTTKVVYRRQSISRGFSCSPLTSPVVKRSITKKKSDGFTAPHIKPFSQVQWNLESRKSSPQVIDDIGTLLTAPTNCDTKPSGPLVPSTPKTQLNSIEGHFKVPPSPVKDAHVESQMMQRGHAYEDFQGADKPMNNEAEKVAKSPLRGILKDTTSRPLNGKRNEVLHTPRIESQNEGRAGLLSRPKRQTRTSSRYFQSADAPAAILSGNRQMWAVRSTESTVTYSKPRRYGKRKDELYDSRFKQNCPK